jgi:hypothetical protein
MKGLLLLAIVLQMAANLDAQPRKTDNFSVEIKVAIGDLNKDGIDDMAVVKQDTTNETWPYRLHVYFQDQKGKYAPMVSTDDAVAPRRPGGKKPLQAGNDLVDLGIANNVLTISAETPGGYYQHKFRYQHNNFELIGFSGVQSDTAGVMTITDFNMSTGARIIEQVNYRNDSLISTTEEKHLIRPLPNLRNFVPNKTELY